MRRWQEKLSSQPHLGRLIERHYAKGNRDDRLLPEVREVVERLIDERYLQRPPISTVTLQAFVRAELRQINIHRPTDDQLPVPGLDALASSIAARDPREVHAARHGEADAAQKYDGVELQEDPEAPLDVVEIDHSTSDLFVVSNELRVPIGRPTIALAVDRCTRMPFGVYIGFEHPSVLTVMQCLKNGILPKTYIRRKVEAGEWTIQNEWPVFGVPRGLLFDRALENLSHDVRRNAAALGITRVRFAKRKTPRHKGAIERFFGTVNKRLLHEQRGTTFSNVLQRRDYDPAKNAIITLDELYEQAHRFLVDIYPRRRHGGIRDVPYRRWNELTRRFSIDPLEDLQEILPLFGRSFYASIQREGVRLKHIVYNSEELALLRRSPAFQGKAGDTSRVAFRYDPADLGTIHVYLPHEKRFLAVKAVPQWRDYADGLSIWEHMTVLRFERERAKGAVDPDSLAEAMVELITKMDNADGRRRSSKTNKRLARLTGHGRISPAGDIYATTPTNSTAAARRGSPARPTTTARLAAKTRDLSPKPQVRPSRAPAGGASGSSPQQRTTHEQAHRPLDRRGPFPAAKNGERFERAQQLGKHRIDQVFHRQLVGGLSEGTRPPLSGRDTIPCLKQPNLKDRHCLDNRCAAPPRVERQVGQTFQLDKVLRKLKASAEIRIEVSRALLQRGGGNSMVSKRTHSAPERGDRQMELLRPGILKPAIERQLPLLRRIYVIAHP